MATLLGIATLFALGALHGAGPDHLAAMGALGGRAPIKTAVRFSLGHLVVLAPAALLFQPLLSLIPASYERTAEIFGGALLVLVGLGALLSSLGWHFHDHQHDDGTSHRHLHTHEKRHAHGHRHFHLAGAVGALLALSSIRVVGREVLSLAGSDLLGALAGVIAFGLGILASMTVAGAVLSLVPRRFPSAGPYVERLLATVAITVGLYWSVSNALA